MTEALLALSAAGSNVMTERETWGEQEEGRSVLKDEQVGEEHPALSKNARKRLLKAEYRQAKWEAKKKLKKEKKKAEQQQRQSEQDEKISEIRAKSQKDIDRAIEERKTRKMEEKKNFLKSCENNFKVIIDCAFEHEHSDNGIRSLSQQIMYAYGVNKRSKNPCSLYITGLGDATLQQLNKTHPENWIATTVHKDPYQTVVRDKKLIYLTADSPNTITTLDKSCAYIIGGIVDRNRLKGITFDKAVAEGIETAKLPLDECVKMMGNSKTKVLTVNHVFEILLKFSENNSWADAFQTTLPERKDVVVLHHEVRNTSGDSPL